VIEHRVLAQIRHDIVHGYWLGLNENQQIVMGRKRRGEPETSQPFTVEQLLGCRDRLSALFVLIENAKRLYRGEVPLLEPSSA